MCPPPQFLMFLCLLSFYSKIIILHIFSPRFRYSHEGVLGSECTAPCTLDFARGPREWWASHTEAVNYVKVCVGPKEGDKRERNILPGIESKFFSFPASSLLATGWTVQGSNPRGGEIFRTCPDRPWGPPSFLYNGYRVFPEDQERPGRDADLSSPSSAVVLKG